MKNAMLRLSYKCASILVASGLAMTASGAETRDLATVNLRESIVVGSTTLPSGHYTITSEGNDIFLIHADNGDHALLLGQRIERTDESAQTVVVLKNDGQCLRLDKLYIEGRTEAYDFAK
jgi:hypothetical protein